MTINSTSSSRVNQLKENPMFCFSMSSLELFHSNFLEWLFVQNTDAFLKCFGVEPKDDKEYVIEREYYLDRSEVNGISKKWITDIAVFANGKNDINTKDKDNLVLIIENKIKSLPSKDQLRFQAKFSPKSCKKVLLTLFEFPKTIEFEESGFEHVAYSRLIEKIEKQNFDKYKLYVDDYCKMIRTMQEILNNDKVVLENKNNIFTFHKHSEDLYDCGLQDAFRKYQAAQLAQRAITAFEGKYPNDQEDTLVTGASLNHKRACTDIFLKMNKDLYAGVQIEHDQFRVCFMGKAIEKHFDKTGKLKEHTHTHYWTKSGMIC